MDFRGETQTPNNQKSAYKVGKCSEIQFRVIFAEKVAADHDMD